MIQGKYIGLIPVGIDTGLMIMKMNNIIKQLQNSVMDYNNVDKEIFINVVENNTNGIDENWIKEKQIQLEQEIKEMWDND